MSDWKQAPHNFPSYKKGGVCFLDLSTRTGWAIGFPSQLPVCGTVHLSDRHEEGVTFAQFYDFLCDLLEFYAPSRMVMEAPLPATVKSNTGAWEVQIGLAGVTRLAARHYGLTVRSANVKTVRQAVLGSGFIPRDTVKGVVMEWCNLQGIYPVDHNAGDACVGLEFCLRTYHKTGFAKDLAAIK